MRKTAPAVDVEPPAEVEQPAAPPAPPAPTYTLEAVRATLAALSQSGKREQVLQLMAKYGAARLTEIDPAQFPALMDDAAGIE